MTAVEDAARAYIAAWHANEDAGPPDWTSARVRLDGALHALIGLVDGRCAWCDPGTCPLGESRQP